MAIMLKHIYDALIEAGASEQTASQAAEELAGYESHFQKLERDMSVLKWIGGTSITLILIVLGLVLRNTAILAEHSIMLKTLLNKIPG